MSQHSCRATGIFPFFPPNSIDLEQRQTSLEYQDCFIHSSWFLSLYLICSEKSSWPLRFRVLFWKGWGKKHGWSNLIARSCCENVIVIFGFLYSPTVAKTLDISRNLVLSRSGSSWKQLCNALSNCSSGGKSSHFRWKMVFMDQVSDLQFCKCYGAEVTVWNPTQRACSCG